MKQLLLACLSIALGFLPAMAAQQPASAAPRAPEILPGKGLAEHDFFYAGEAKDERMFIVKRGQIVWSYSHPGRGEISDAVLLPNGNVLFAHQHAITEITADKKVVWNYDAPANTEIHTAQPLGAESVWFVQNGDPAKFMVVNKSTGKIEREFVLPVKNPKRIHGQFRQARMADAGTLLVAHMDLGKAVEYDLDGKALRTVDLPGIWSVKQLQNGNLLATSNRGFVREINRQGETVWEWTRADAPGYTISNLQTATRLPSGNTIINNWFNQWSDKLDLANPPVQAIEVTREKKVVWALRSWAPPADLGPSTTIQILDEFSTP
jgi:outer membrane protein assembly factor BamB